MLESDLLTYFHSYIGYPEVTAKTQIGEWGIQRTTLKFPILYELGLIAHTGEALHLKVEVSQHKQVFIVQKTPVLQFGRSYVASHFTLETMMAGKLIACLERDFHKGESTVKGRDYYDILWFMQQKIWPLEEKLAKDGQQPYTTQSALALLYEKVQKISINELAEDLLLLFEKRTFIEGWLESFKENFSAYYHTYLNSRLP